MQGRRPVSIVLSRKLRLLGGEPAYWCPGCECAHQVAVSTPNEAGAHWQWNGNAEAPTFSPSVHIVGRCHCFVRAGRIEFMADCAHVLAGKTVDVPDWPQ